MATFGASTKGTYYSTGDVSQGWTLSEAGNFTSISTSIFKPFGSANVFLAIYSDRTDVGAFDHYPYQLKGQTGAITTTGEVTANLLSPVSLPAGFYWLVWHADSAGCLPDYLGTPVAETLKFNPIVPTEGVFPSTAPTDISTDNNHQSYTRYLYATYTPVALSTRNSRFWYKP